MDNIRKQAREYIAKLEALLVTAGADEQIESQAEAIQKDEVSTAEKSTGVDVTKEDLKQNDKSGESWPVAEGAKTATEEVKASVEVKATEEVKASTEITVATEEKTANQNDKAMNNWPVSGNAKTANQNDKAMHNWPTNWEKKMSAASTLVRYASFDADAATSILAMAKDVRATADEDADVENCASCKASETLLAMAELRQKMASLAMKAASEMVAEEEAKDEKKEAITLGDDITTEARVAVASQLLKLADAMLEDEVVATEGEDEVDASFMPTHTFGKPKKGSDEGCNKDIAASLLAIAKSLSESK